MSYILNNTINGVTVSNTPSSAGQILVATSGTTAMWANPATKPQNLGTLEFWLQRNTPGSGTTWTDTQKGYNATLNSATWASGGTGVSFAGTTASNATGTGTTFPLGGAARTLAVRFNPVALPGAIFGYGTNGTNQIQVISASATNITYWGGSSNVYTVTTGVPTGAWSVISCSYDGTNASIYLNGTYLGSAPRSWSTVGTAYIVGRNVSGISGNYFNGTVSDVLLYSSVLNDAQHAQLAQQLALL